MCLTVTTAGREAAAEIQARVTGITREGRLEVAGTIIMTSELAAGTPLSQLGKRISRNASIKINITILRENVNRTLSSGTVELKIIVIKPTVVDSTAVLTTDATTGATLAAIGAQARVGASAGVSKGTSTNTETRARGMEGT